MRKDPKTEKKRKEKKKENIIKNNLYILGLVWKISPTHVVLTFIMRFLSFVSWTFYTVVFMRYLFGSNEGSRTFEEAVLFIWIVVAVNLFYYFLSNWFTWRYSPRVAIKIHYSLNRMLFEKASSVDISCYENPEFYNEYTKATTEAFNRAMAVQNNIATLFSSLCSSVYVIITMCTITPYAIILVVGPILGNLYFGKKLRKEEYELDKDNIPFRRRYDYINRVVYLRKYSAEMRMTGFFGVLKKMYDTAYDGIIKNISAYARKRYINSTASALLLYPFAFLGMWLLGAYLVMVVKSITLGDYVVLSSAIVSTTWMVFRFTEAMTASFENGMFIENLKTFMHYTPKIDENQKGITLNGAVKTIELKNISFKYDGQEKFALKDINMVLKSGEKVAIVGINGSGKSTLVKLIMRLYDPTEGEILLNGINIKEYNLHEYRMLIGTTFQDFIIFSATVLENVVMGKVENEAQRKKAAEALNESGVFDKIDTLQKGVDTVLTREFDSDGAELSGGEKQKIAVARAFAKASPIIILDEPSSVLDPIAEFNMYETIFKLCDKYDPAKGKISIIISHRLSSAALSDRIFVIDGGELSESGSHKELMIKNGKYADMFKKQAENYLAAVLVGEGHA
ncbi:MAG: ABC transporter ATP-binding protein [Firmicutes bacterium HGW-Firmicutes-21]|nr:MAG: ABC transporter ATP-binding protein [Firmicutes bacterium HGW-Firmicutes-21]